MSRVTRRQALALGAAGVAAASLPAADAANKVLVFVGPSNHPPGTHEVAATGRLLGWCLADVGIPADVRDQWPADDALAAYSAMVFVGDYFPPAVLKNGKEVMAAIGKRMSAGVGMVCLHYATGLTAEHVAADGDHPLLGWLGGYFATRCTHHQSVAKVFPKATVEKAAGEHPVSRGWKGFTFHDEPYIRNWFGKGGPAKGVSVLATSQLPPEKPATETIAWAVDRPDGGRGVGVVFPHFYRNWVLDDMRTLVLNAVAWAAKRDVPAAGVRSAKPDLAAFQPASVEPVPRKKG